MAKRWYNEHRHFGTTQNKVFFCNFTGSLNSCGYYQPVYVSEINPAGGLSDTFVELHDGGSGFSSLDALVLVLFEEEEGVPHGVIPLTGNHTNR